MDSLVYFVHSVLLVLVLALPCGGFAAKPSLSRFSIIITLVLFEALCTSACDQPTILGSSTPTVREKETLGYTSERFNG